MTKKPKLLKLYALFFGCIAVAFPVQIMVLYGHMPNEVISIAAKLSILNWMVMLLSLINGILVYRASTYFRWSLPPLFLLVLINNLVVGLVGMDFSASLTGLATVAFGSLLVPLYKHQIYTIFKNPSKRWWLAPKRVPAAINVILTSHDGESIEARTFDISIGGTFVSLMRVDGRASQKEDDWHNWEADENITVALSFGLFQQVHCQARVVRVNDEAKGKYPAGFGLRFEELDRKSRGQIQSFVDNCT